YVFLDMQLPTFFELLKDSWAYAKQNARLLVPIFLKFVGVPIIAVIVITVLVAIIASNIFLAVAVGSIFGIAAIIIACGAAGGINEVAIAAVQGREIRFTFGRMWAILGVTVLIAVAQAVLTIPFRLANIPFLSILIGVIIGGRFYLLSTVLV